MPLEQVRPPDVAADGPAVLVTGRVHDAGQHPASDNEEIVDELRSGRMSLCDGPLTTGGMRSYIVGRVVGFVAAA